MNYSSLTIASERLDLILLTPDFLQYSSEGDHIAAEQLLGLSIPTDWYDEKALMCLRLQQLTCDPSYYIWCLRAISLRQQYTMVGYIGFHTSPGAVYLQPIAPNGVEFGYVIFPLFQRQGYAREACQSLMKWAYEEQHISEFVVSISPENTPSLHLVQSMGFRKVGSHIDEEDGPEDIFKCNYPRL